MASEVEERIEEARAALYEAHCFDGTNNGDQTSLTLLRALVRDVLELAAGECAGAAKPADCARRIRALMPEEPKP